MDASTLATAGVHPGDTTIQCVALDARYQKLFRLRNLKMQLREISTEIDRLQVELYGQPQLGIQP